ncbi:CENP-Q, a CENPA-CAD centromere complex subunit-domain-containing protein [Xylaria digitata]|nr:CENP-Q, a CENPA-CAD centromere complex subunit-domain-containing protein [Xylaria digitata]
MDPPAANQKRKRGRRTNASRDDEARDALNSTAQIMPQDNLPEVNGGVEDGDVDEGSRRPRKRNRRTKDDVPQKPQPESSTTQRSRRGRRQSSADQMEETSTGQASGSAPSDEIKTKKRGRPRRGAQHAKPPGPEAEEADDENENEGNSSLLRRSERHRRSLDEPPIPSENGSIQDKETESQAAQQPVKRRKRPVRAKDKEQSEEEAEPEAEVETISQRQKRKGKRRRSLEDIQAFMHETEPGLEPVLPQKKRGRPPRSEGRDENSSTGAQNRSSQRQKETADEDSQTGSRQPGSNETHQKSNPRKRSLEGQDQSPVRSSSPASVSSPPPYRSMVEQTRRVTHNTMETKWSSLDSSSITKLGSLLYSVSLPTLHHVPQKQYAHAEDVLEKLIKALCRKSGKLPFPLASTLPRREDELDFEKTQSAVEVLQSQLDPLQHSVELLRREKERAEKDLEREYKVLDRLSANARADARERRERLRKVHVLVPETTYGSTANKIDLLSADKTTSQVFTSIRDEELLNLAGQINNHMESMRGNLQQIDGVLPAIAKSHATLRATLQPQFSQKQLEDIMLGPAEQ